MKTAFTLLIILLICISCANKMKNERLSSTQQNEKLYIVDLDKTQIEDRVRLSSFFDKVETIILETSDNCLIGEANANGLNLDLYKKEELMKLTEESNPVIFCYSSLENH